ncbi:putative ANTH domain, ENTH domain, ANTH domain superfamily protein [Helianthus debilis subsp. tardiflorus]
MRLWKRVFGALKDQNSLLKARLVCHLTSGNPDIEKAIIKATSHDESCIDFHNTQCVFSWIRHSDENFQPTLSVISKRLEKTHNWVVALKGLMLMHGVFCCNVSSPHTIGHLPFDLSNFKHGHSESAKNWSFEAFVRSYYDFLEQKSMVLLHFSKQPNNNKTEEHLILQDLVCLHNLQLLLDTLLQIKPRYATKSNTFVLEAMDCLVVESFDIYSRICDGIMSVLADIYSCGMTETNTMLTILEKATVQGVKLSQYLEFCRQLGVNNASECPKSEQIDETDIQDLEVLIEYTSDESEEMKSLVMDKKMMTKAHESIDSKGGLKAIIANEWDVFDEDDKEPD